MDKLVIASMRQNAGKTSVIVGLGQVLNQKFGYMKPLGDRLLYSKKQLWDHDAALITNIFGLTGNPTDMSLGFNHAKLRFMYDEETTKAKLLEAVSNVAADKELLLVEAGKDITYGISVYLDALSLAEYIGGRLLMVVSGDEDAILDDIAFARKHIEMTGIEFGGVIINKLQDVENFKNTHLAGITEMGVDVLGTIPYEPQLTRFSVGYLADRLFAKVISGAEAVNNVVENILVGAMSVDAVIRRPELKFENSLVITGGDRTDMILYALESNALGIILTNNILPPPNIISKASERQIPLLLVTPDTYQVAKQVDDLESLLTRDDTQKIALWKRLVQEHVNVEKVLGH